MEQRCLVTGGAGFIGSHLAETLLEADWHVLVVDDLSTGSETNIAHLLGNSRFEFLEGSILDRNLICAAISRVELVFHLAAAVGVRLVTQRPVHTMRVNFGGSQLVLEASARQNRPILVASSSEVYGKLDKKHFSEDDDLVLGSPSNPRWCYAASKLLTEHLIAGNVRAGGLRAIVVRLFNTIGPRQSAQYGMVVPRFVSQARNDLPITIYGDGTQRRSFTWVKDVAEAMVRLAGTESAFGSVYNIGHESDISILQLAQLVRARADSRSRIIHVPYAEVYGERFEDIPHRVPDLSRIRKAVGYRPTFALASMIDRILATLQQ